MLKAALPHSLTAALLARAEATRSRFRPARIGREIHRRTRLEVRQDRIRWLSPDDPIEAQWLGWMEALRVHLNRSLFLGLFDFESHFACYPPGARYRRHRDSFKGASNRILSCIVYLNRDWMPDDGGELVLFAGAGDGDGDGDGEETDMGTRDRAVAGAVIGDAEIVRVLPEFATLVVFLSEDFPHEVLPATRDRYSVTGWFRLNDLMRTGLATLAVPE